MKRIRWIIPTFLAASVLALSACGSSNHCDGSHPYACHEQEATEREASDRSFNQKVASIAQKLYASHLPPCENAKSTERMCEIDVLLEYTVGERK